MKKALIIVGVLLVAIPIVPKLIPEAMTLDKVESALTAAGYTLTDVRNVDVPRLGAIAMKEMTVNGASVELYEFDDEGEIAKQLEYQKPDAGSAIVETWNLSESLGAAKPKSKPVKAARNGMFMLVVMSEDKALRERVASVFAGL